MQPSRLRPLPVEISSFMSHLTLDIISRSFVFVLPFLWTDSAFLVFPLKWGSLTKPQHSNSVYEDSVLLPGVVKFFLIINFLQGSFG